MMNERLEEQRDKEWKLEESSTNTSKGTMKECVELREGSAQMDRGG